MFLSNPEAAPRRSLADELREEEFRHSEVFAARERTIRSHRSHPTGESGIYFQPCGGGIRILKKRISAE